MAVPAPASRDLPRAVRRGIAGAVVVALHIVAALLFALPPLTEGAPGRAAGDPAMTVEFITPQTVTDVPVNGEIPAPSMGESWALTAVEMPVLPFDEVADTEPSASNEFRPPRLRPQHGPTLANLAASAGVVLAKTSRVILTVAVSAEGTAGEVGVAVSSGDAKLDSVAIEYARTLRWDPAIVQGRETNMSIRLPVVFPTTG